MTDKFNIAQSYGGLMRINFDVILKNLEGIDMKWENEPLTLKFLAVSSLLATDQGENPTAGEKVSRYALARRIHIGEWDLVGHEIEKVKAQIGRHFNTLIVGLAYEQLTKDSPAQVTESRPEGKKTRRNEAQASA